MPAASEVLRHNLLILVGLPSRIQGGGHFEILFPHIGSRDELVSV